MIFVNDVTVEFRTYPNGEAVVPSLDWENMPGGTPVTVRLQWSGDEDLLRLALVRGLIRQRYGSSTLWPNLFIDYMPYSRMDREQDGHCFSLKWVAEAIKRLEWRRIEVVEPHSQPTLDLLDAQPVWATTALLRKTMAFVTFDYVRDFLVLPDAGAYKRYSELAGDVFSECNVITLEKRRDFDTGKILGQDVESVKFVRFNRPGPGSQTLIVDDLCSRGGTFVQAASILRHSSLRCGKVNLLVTHMEPVGYTGALTTTMDRVFCSDTMPYDGPVPANFHVFDREDWL